MKSQGLILILLGVLTLAASANPLQEAPTQVTTEVEMDVLMVRLPQPRALTIIPKLRDRRQVANATKDLLKEVAAGKATLIAWPVLTTHSGQRAVVEQIDELRYATEYHAPSKSTTVDPAAPAAVVPPPALSPATPPPAPTGPVTETIYEAVPATFETRNIGVTWEVEPIIRGDGRTIDVNIVLQHVRLTGMEKVTVERPQTGAKVILEQPKFLTHKVTTSLSMEDGDDALLGVFKVADLPGQTELFILSVRIKRVEDSAKKPVR